MTNPARGRLAFVPPRYGAEIVGGSEAVMREAAQGLARRGWDVEVFTTCARDHYTWENEYPAGTTTEDDVVVHRFPVERPRAKRSRGRIEERIVSEEPVSIKQQRTWLDGLFRVPELFNTLVVTADRYDALILSPYLFWTTVTAATIAPERTIVMPCLHDEPYAYLDVLRPVLSDVARLWFLSEPEHQLAHRIAHHLPAHDVTGAGVHVPEQYRPEKFVERHHLERPFILFAGRRERGKGWDWLGNAFHFAIQQYDVPFDLVAIGVGPQGAPVDGSGRVHILGYLDADEVADAFAAATAYIQPSTNESFSRTIMESWLAGTPVLASAGSEVLQWHCDRSGGGLTFGDEFELAQCLSFLAAAPANADVLARAGRDYVLANYRWDVVLDSMEASLRELMCEPS